MRYAKTRSGDQFVNSTAVVMSECLKLFTCLIILFFEKDKSISKFSNHLFSLLFINFKDTLKVSIPSFLYVIQNNLLYVALENFPAATYQVCYQSKILTTAIFSITMLRKDISKRQWLALILLFLGIGIVQRDSVNAVEKGLTDEQRSSQNHLVGFTAVVLACTTSGFAGVYFEKILKNTSTNPSKPELQYSLWTRNIQLGLFGIFLGLTTSYLKDRHLIQTNQNGFFHGYDIWTILTILNSAIGGLLVAVVIKYADNILKGFACSISIVVSCVASVFLFEFEITREFCYGTCLVMMAVFLYSRR